MHLIPCLPYFLRRGKVALFVASCLSVPQTGRKFSDKSATTELISDTHRYSQSPQLSQNLVIVYTDEVPR